MTDTKKLTPEETKAQEEKAKAEAAAADKAKAAELEALKAELRAELAEEMRAEAEAKANEQRIALENEAKADVAAMTGEGTALATGGQLLIRIQKGEKKTVAKCPKTHVPMKALGTRRVCCTSGAVYLFHDEQIEYVNKEDRNEVAAAGAAEVTK